MTLRSVALGLDEFADALRTSWDAQTSSDPGWLAAVPSRGQCAVSALVIQDEFGGDLIRAMVRAFLTTGIDSPTGRRSMSLEISSTAGARSTRSLFGIVPMCCRSRTQRPDTRSSFAVYTIG